MDALIEESDGYLGDLDHSLKLQVGMTQHMMFGDCGSFGNPEMGPFWWSEEDRVQYKFDHTDGVEDKHLLNTELQNYLAANGLAIGGTLQQRSRKDLLPMAFLLLNKSPRF